MSIAENLLIKNNLPEHVALVAVSKKPISDLMEAYDVVNVFWRKQNSRNGG
jgi:hypothetical protein